MKGLWLIVAFRILAAEDEEITLNNIVEPLQEEGEAIGSVKSSV